MSTQVLFGQLLVGLINGSFYALLALGFAIIFGLLGIINVAQGTFYMIGAFGAWMLLHYAWPRLLAGASGPPVVAGIVGMALEKTLISRIYKLDHIYGLLLTYGLMMFIMGMFIYFFQTAPAALSGAARTARRLQSRLHVPAEISRLGRGRCRWCSVLPLGTSSRRRRSAATCARRRKIRC